MLPLILITIAAFEDEYRDRIAYVPLEKKPGLFPEKPGFLTISH